MSSRSESRPRWRGSFVHKLLQAAEAGQNADDLTCTSGPLGPRSLNQDQPCGATKHISCGKAQSQQTPNPPALQKRQTKEGPTCARKNEKKESASDFTSSTALVESEFLRSSRDQETDHPSHADRREDKTAPEPVCSSSLPLQQEKSSQEKASSSSDPAHQEAVNNDRQRVTEAEFAREVSAAKNLWAGRDVAQVHERKLHEEVKKLAAESRSFRDRLAVFSDVFDDVCEGSPVFGGVLREIKTQYDLYVNHLIACQSSLPKTLTFSPSAEASLTELGTHEVTEREVEEAEEEVYRLEREAKRALEEKQRVQNELRNIPANRGPEDSDLTCLQDGAGGRTDCVQVRRLQVLDVLNDIHQMEEDMKDNMVSGVTAAAAERRLKEQKTEMVKLIATNQRLRAITEDLEDKINTVLNREKASKSIRRMLWDEIYGDVQTEKE